MSLNLDASLATWRGSAGNERVINDSFPRDFCILLELPVPEPAFVGSDALIASLVEHIIGAEKYNPLVLGMYAIANEDLEA